MADIIRIFRSKIKGFIFSGSKGRENMKKNPIGQKALSLLLSLTLILSIFGVDTMSAFAAQDSGIKRAQLLQLL